MQFKSSRGALKEPARRYAVPAVLVAIFAFQWAVLFTSSTPSWDGAMYYAYTHSMVFDGDMHIANDLQLGYAKAVREFAAARMDLITTETGRVDSPFAIGSALIWAPWLAILRGLAGLGQLAGLVPKSLTGYEWYFTMGVASLSMILGWLAFWLAYRLALQISRTASAALATLTVLFATPLLYYMYAEALFAHATAAFITALFITIWWRYFRRPSSYAMALAIGGLLGLTGLVRWQHIVYAVLPLSSIIAWWLSLPASERRARLLRAVLLALTVGLGTVAVLSLQLVHWRLLYGQWITVPQGSWFMDWRAPYLQQVLFSSFRGLLAWMPVFFLALVGLILNLRKHTAFVLPLLIVLFLETYVNSSSADWFGGGGYGPRRFTGEVTIMVIGYAALLQWLPEKVRLVGGGLMAVALVVQQWLLLRFGTTEAIGGRVLSMIPPFRWAEDGYSAFFQQLGARLTDVARRPWQALHWPDSPLGVLYDGRLPVRHVLTLAATLLFVGLIWLIVAQIGRRSGPISAQARWLALALIGMAVLGANLWLLFWA